MSEKVERKRIEAIVTALLAREIPAPNFKDAGTIGNVRKKINTAIDYAEEICVQIDTRGFDVGIDLTQELNGFLSRVLLGMGMSAPPGPVQETLEKLRESGELRPGTLIFPDSTVTQSPAPIHKEWVDELLNQNAPSETATDSGMSEGLTPEQEEKTVVNEMRQT